jgi:PGF-CTERM protein
MASLPTRLVVSVLSIVLACSLAVGGVGIFTGDGTAAAVHENSDSPDWVHEANFTLTFPTYEPGVKTDVMFWASLPQTDAYGDGLGEAKFVKMWLPQGDVGGDLEEASCTREDMVVAGIDRGSNDSGVTVDTSLVSNIKNYELGMNDAGQTWAVVESYGKDDFGGDHVGAHYSDEAIVKMEDCFTVPGQPGWYRGGIYANGSNYEGEYIEAAGYTAYFPVCDCEDREDAIETLGEPPVTGTGVEGSVIRADGDGVFGEPLDGGPPSGWDLGEQRDPGAQDDTGGEPPSTATATPAGSSDGGGDGAASDGSTPTATASAPGSDGTPTATASSGGPNDGGSDGPDPTATVRGDASQDGGQTTPTASEGPGFGSIAALVGVLAASLLALRRH